ncbi:MAG TPA: hypothetical protein VFO41_13150, partial [Alphaproteobacteria bacterium]|nr:hypothetical protein [Alphaproteobacteria bacterium]
GDRLTILDRALFERVTQAIGATEDALAARRSAASIEETLDGQLPWNERKMYQMELPSVRATASAREGEARAHLQAGFLQAGLPAAHDEEALRAALDAHGSAVGALGEGQSGFEAIVDGARQQALDQLNELFGPLRPSIAAAQGTGDWRAVRDDAIRQFDALVERGPDREAVRAVGDILVSGGPIADRGYVQAIEDAVEHVLVRRPVEAVEAAANDLDAALDDPQGTPELVRLDELTADVSPDLAARIAIGADHVVERSIADLLHATVTTGIPIETTPGEVTFNRAVDNLAAVAERAGKAEDGSAAVERLAAPLVLAVDQLSANTEDAGLRLAGDIGVALRESVAEGGSPALAVEIARQLNGQGYADEASRVLELTAQGVERLRENAAEAGQTFESDVLYVNQVAAPNFRPDEQMAGLESLLESQKPLVDRVDRYGEAVVLTLEALEDLPAGLTSLAGGTELTAAGNALRADVEAEDGDVTSTVRFSQGAAMELERIAQDATRAVMDTIPDEDLERILDWLSELPPNSPYADLADRLGTGDAAVAALRESPGLALMLNQLAAQDAGSSGGNPNAVPGEPSAGFISREVKNSLFALAGYAGPDGSGLLPGLPLQPDPQVTDAASQAGDRRTINAAARDFLRNLDPEWRSQGGYYQLSQIARAAWLKLYPIEEIDAARGLPARPIIGPAAHGASATLNAWGAATLVNATTPDGQPYYWDRAWGYYFTAGTVKDLALLVDGLYRPGDPGRTTSFSRIDGLRGWSWLPRLYNWGGQFYAGLYAGHQFAKGDVAMGLAWLPATIGGFYGLSGAAAAGPVGAAGWIATAILTTAISQYRHVQAANHHEPMFGAYLEGAR